MPIDREDSAEKTIQLPEINVSVSFPSMNEYLEVQLVTQSVSIKDNIIIWDDNSVELKRQNDLKRSLKVIRSDTMR